MNKLKIKDLVSIGMFSALYFIFVLVGVILSMIILRQFNMALAPMGTALVAGLIFILLNKKVAKFGAITIIAAVLGIFFFLSGHFALSLIPALVFGFTADLIAKIGNYKNRLTNLLSYIVFSFSTIGPIAMMWYAKDAYVAKLIAKGKDLEYINRVMVEYSLENVIFYILGISICSFVGYFIGEFLFKKYFDKSGLI